MPKFYDFETFHENEAYSISPESYEKIWKGNFLLLGIHSLL